MSSKVTLLKSCASDLDVVNAARCSFNKHTDTMREEDEKLIGFLLRNNHMTPFEHNYFQWHVKCPIFVAREWFRHRIGWSYNEVSGRYVALEKEFYEPEQFREQQGKPGQYSFVPREEHWPGENTVMRACMDDVYEQAYGIYTYLVENDVAKEQARAVLPVGIMTQFYASCNARSLMHFLTLRTSSVALKEIADLARAMLIPFSEHMPHTYNAWTRITFPDEQ